MVKSESRDEVSVIDILKVVWKRKLYISLFVFIVTLATVIIVLEMDNIYTSAALLKPSQNGTKDSSVLASIGGIASLAGVNIGSTGNVKTSDVLSSIMSDKAFLADVAKKHHFESKLLPDYEKEKNEPEVKDNLDYLLSKSILSGLVFGENVKTSVVTLAFYSKDRVFADEFVKTIMRELSDRYMKMDITGIDKQIKYYNSEIDRTSDITLKNSLADVVSGLIQKKVVARSSEYYGFDVIVQPSVASSRDKVRPKRTVIVLISFITSLLAAVFVAIAKDKFDRDKLSKTA